MEVIAREKPKVIDFPTIEKVLKYENSNVIDGLLKALKITEEEASELFREGIKWLWYCANPKSKGHRIINDPLLIIDEVWHTFILYTPFYADFCNTYFGYYLHHMPTLIEDEEKSKHMTAVEKKQRRKEQLETIYDLMGKETFIKWYHIYPDRYPKEKILELRKK